MIRLNDSRFYSRSFIMTAGPVRVLGITLLMLASFTARAHGQFRPVSAMKSNQASKRGLGSAGVLSGHVHVYNIFARDHFSDWNAEQKQTVLDKVQQAYRFLTEHCGQHGVEVKFTDESSAEVLCSHRIPIDTFVDPRWTEKVIGTATGKSGNELVSWLRKETSADHVLICLHINKSALSYNLAVYDRVSDHFAAERMICFASYPDDRPTAAATYAHEILHLFGAGDLYFPFDSGDERKKQAAELFPHDVMYRVDYNLGRLNIGPFTAYRVGWTDELDPKHRFFED